MIAHSLGRTYHKITMTLQELLKKRMLFPDKKLIDYYSEL